MSRGSSGCCRTDKLRSNSGCCRTNTSKGSKGCSLTDSSRQHMLLQERLPEAAQAAVGQTRQEATQAAVQYCITDTSRQHRLLLTDNIRGSTGCCIIDRLFSYVLFFTLFCLFRLLFSRTLHFLFACFGSFRFCFASNLIVSLRCELRTKQKCSTVQVNRFLVCPNFHGHSKEFCLF